MGINNALPLIKAGSDKTCDTCNHSKVCMYKEEFQKAYHDIKEVGERTNVFIAVIVNCKHWIAGITNVR